MKKYIILSFLAISLFSCRVAKKQWAEETFASKLSLNEKIDQQEQRMEKSFQEISTSFQSKLVEISESRSSSSSESENENTTVTGTITAEDGKEKSVTVGGTTIRSSGANVTFETNSSKSLSKEFETKYQALEKQFQEERITTTELRTELNSLKSELSEIKSQLEADRSSESKEVTKRGFSFGVWMIVVIVIIILILLWYFRKKISFLK